MILWNIKPWVDARGWSIMKFAEVAGIAYPTAYGLYQGRVNRIDLTTLDKVCAALEVEPGKLFRRFADELIDDRHDQ